MFKSDSDGNDGIVVVAVVVFLVIAALVGFYQGIERGQAISAENYSQSHKDYATEKIQNTCIGFEVGLVSECIEKAIDASIENQRAEKDLAAQQNMAVYAKWLLGLGWLTFAVTAFGVWFVRDTLLETRRAVSAAEGATVVSEKYGHLQSRAYLTSEPFGMMASSSGGSGRYSSLQIEYSFKNTGQTPSYKTHIRTSLVTNEKKVVDWLPEPMIEQGRGSNPLGRATVGPGERGLGLQVVDIKELQFAIASNMPMFLCMRVDYETLGKRYFTEVCAELEFRGQIGQLGDASINPMDLFRVLIIGPNNSAT